MSKNYEELFQDRVDELLLLEQRADRRAEQFVEITQDCQKKSQKAFTDLLDKTSNIDSSLAKITAASDQVRDYVAQSAQHALRTTHLFLGTVIACVLLIVGTFWWTHRIINGVAQDKVDLAALDTKLKHTPVIMHFRGKDYVRVVPDSETGFTRGGDEVLGRYSEVWHVR